MNNLTDVKQLQRILTEIKMYNSKNPNASMESKALQKELVTLLGYMTEFDLMVTCFEKNEIMASVIADIDTRINLINRERQIEQKNIEGKPLVNTSKALLASTNYLERLTRMRDALQNRNFKYYIEALNNQMKTADSLIAMCSSTLKEGVPGVETLFGNQLITGKDFNSEALEQLFLIVTDERLRTELKMYLQCEDNVNKVETSINNNNEFLGYIEKVHFNHTLFKEFISLRSFFNSSKEEQNQTFLMARIQKLKLELESLPTSGVKSIACAPTRNKIKNSITYYEECLEEIKDKLRRKEEVEAELTRKGLGEIVKCYGETNCLESPVEKATDYIKHNLRSSYPLSLTDAKSRIETMNEDSTKQLTKLKKDLDVEKTHLSTQALNLVTTYPEDVKKVFILLKARPSGGIAPLLATYALMAFVEAKKLTFEEIKEAASLPIDTLKLFESYDNMVKTEAITAQKKLVDLEQDYSFKISEALMPEKTEDMPMKK